MNSFIRHVNEIRNRYANEIIDDGQLLPPQCKDAFGNPICIGDVVIFQPSNGHLRIGIVNNMASVAPSRINVIWCKDIMALDKFGKSSMQFRSTEFINLGR